MAENVLQPVEVPVPLEFFGGLVTEMSPSDLPEGISPDCQDIVFLPGGIQSRPGARGWLDGLLVAGRTITYQKTFTTPAGRELNLILVSNGTFYVQDTSNPAVITPIANVTPGSYATSVSAFGKELVCFHDTQQGTDIPRIYDGVNFDRATQCGPGAPPTVANVIIAPTTMAVSGSPALVAITSMVTTNPVTYGHPGNTYTIYTTITVTCASTAGLLVNDLVTIAGNSLPYFNSLWTVFSIIDSTHFNLYFNQVTNLNGNGGTYVISGGTTIQRVNNSVTVTTAAPHNLQVGFQVQISDVPDATVGTSISSVVIDNEINSGIATITTTTPHGLLPENNVKLLGIPDTVVGTSISSIVRAGDVVTVTTFAGNNLSANAVVKISGVTDATFNGQFTIVSIENNLTFTYTQVDVDATSTGGTVSLTWPNNSGSLLDNFYQVVSVPTPTTFTVQIFYADGTWTGGTVTFSWLGTFYVTSIINQTSFVYQQQGPNASNTAPGTVTPFSQIAPGNRGVVVLFQTRSGFIPAPSPPVQITTNGGQYLTISSIPLGPPNVIARLIAFTGADGSNYFYINSPAHANGIQISTSTVISDNVTTTLLVDFSDATLFNSTAIDIPGNNLFEMGVLGPCLGVDSYASRAMWWGMKNSIPNLLNLGFEGGYLTLQNPLGWTIDTSGGILDTSSADFGMAWLITPTGANGEGMIEQPAYQDYNGVSIFQPLTQYTVNLRLFAPSIAGGNGGDVIVDLYSPTNGVMASATFPFANLSIVNGAFFAQNFSAAFSYQVPQDLVLRIYTNQIPAGSTISIDEIEIYPTLNPTIPTFLGSYINFPESIDLETGPFGPSDDDTPIQCTFTYRDAFLFLTQFGLHETSDLEGYEPDNWVVKEISRNCGACGPKVCSTGENFSVWVTSPSTQPPVGRGLYIYTGGAVYKLSQEVQPDFDSVNSAGQTRIWTTVDSVTRRIYVGLPIGANLAPNRMYVLDYREMDTASDIASRSPIHISFSGKMICSDLSRKWTRWNLSANCGAIMSIPGVGIQFSIGTGNGNIPNPAILPSGFSNCFRFDDTLFTDESYGQINPYYTTYFFVNHDLEQSLQVGAHRKLFKRYAIFISGLGKLSLLGFGDNLTNQWPATPQISLSAVSNYDIGDGLNIIAERCAFRIATVPLTGQTDNWFSLGKFIITVAQEPVSPIRFGAI